MLKQTIAYTDFDDNPTTETLYFNITKSELLDNIHLKDELEALTDRLKGDARELTTDEVKEILNLVKTFMQLSYGVRSADGKRFTKNDEQWEDFKQTAAYDAFLMSLFEDASKAISFLMSILPKDLREEAEKAVQQDGEASVTELPTAPPVLEGNDEAPSKPDEPSDEALLKMKPQDMTHAQLQRAFALKNGQ